MSEIIIALAIGVLAGSGVWLLLRPRTFQVAIGLSLLSYAVNLFIFAMGRLRSGAAPIVPAGTAADPEMIGARPVLSRPMPKMNRLVAYESSVSPMRT